MTTAATTPTLRAIWFHSIMTGVASTGSLVLGYWLNVCDGLFSAMLTTVFFTPMVVAFVPDLLLGVVGFGAAATLAARVIVINRWWCERIELLVFPFAIASVVVGYAAAGVIDSPMDCSLGQWR